jgi:hypothetical protein
VRKTEKLELKILQPDNFLNWDEAVSRSSQGNIFSKSFWLNCYDQSSYKILGIFSDGRVVGGIALPSQNGNLKRSKMITPIVPYFEQTDKTATLIEINKRFLSPLAEYICREYEAIDLSWHPSLINWLPFYWSGFSQTTKFTYILNLDQSNEEIWRGFQTKIRTDIRKSEAEGIKITQGGMEDFIEIAKNTNNYAESDFELFRRIYSNLHPLGKISVLVARATNGKALCAGVFLLDDGVSYYWLGAHQPKENLFGAPSLLIWKFIDSKPQQLRELNFLGSVMPNVEKFFRGFGGDLVPYNIVSLKRPKVVQKLANTIRRMIK